MHVPIPDIALPHLYDGELIDRQGKGRPTEQGIETMENAGAEEWWLCGAWGSGCVMRAAKTVKEDYYVGVITDLTAEKTDDGRPQNRTVQELRDREHDGKLEGLYRQADELRRCEELL